MIHTGGGRVGGKLMQLRFCSGIAFLKVPKIWWGWAEGRAGQGTNFRNTKLIKKKKDRYFKT